MFTLSNTLKLLLFLIHVIFPISNSHIESLSVIIQRDELHNALLGDLEMIKVITDNISDDLSSYENSKAKIQLTELIKQTNSSLSNILEDKKNSKKKKGSYVAQCELSATVLMFCCEPEEIVAIPKRIRSRTDVFDCKVMSQIELNASRVYSDRIKLRSPSMGFVSYLSNPSIIRAFEKQQIPLVYTTTHSDVYMILDEINNICETAGKKCYGHLLKNFVNLVIEFSKLKKQSLKIKYHLEPNILYLQHYENHYGFTENHLLIKLTKHLGIKSANEKITGGYTKKMSDEKLYMINPDIVFISSACQIVTKKNCLNMNTKYIPLNDTIANSPTQLIGLLAYDLVATLEQCT
ncbi:hypothetical protein N9N03_01760 [Chlamydiia bacterium]|nr:hypothetical protein [Chlamydiia bacterium]